MKRPKVRVAKCCLHCVYRKGSGFSFCGLRIKGKTGKAVEPDHVCSEFKGRSGRKKI